MKPDWRGIELENRGLSIRHVRSLGEGWNCRACLVNDELVFRFPKRADVWQELNREIAFLTYAADRLPLAAPRYVQVAPDSPAAPYGYAVYRYLPGHTTDVNTLTMEKRAQAAESIAVFLRALHALQPNPAVSALLPREDARMLAQDYLKRAEREITPKLEPLEARVLCQQFDRYLSAPGNFSFRPVVLHADLSRDHVLMKDDAVAAVIDFGDVNWGDPDYDFMHLFVDFGPAFAGDVARRYGHANLEQVDWKLRYFAIVDQIGTIVDGAGRALDGQREASWRVLKQLLRRRN